MPTDADQQMNEAAAIFRVWRGDPIRFVREVFDKKPFEPDPWQRDALKLYQKNERVAMCSCAGPGKSCLLAMMILHFLVTHPYAKIVATAITSPNLKDNLWSEIAKWIAGSSLLEESLVWTSQRVYVDGEKETWFASARTWDRSADEDIQGQTLSGIHADYCMAIVDEAGGVPSAVVASAEGVLSSAVKSRMVIAGNPIQRSGPLWDAFGKDKALWSTMQVTGDPDDPRRAPRVRKEWAEQQIQKYGRRNAWVRAKVLGKFPIQATDALCGADAFEAAYGAYLGPVEGMKVLSVDVARSGEDRNFVTFRCGRYAVSWEAWVGWDTVTTSDRVDFLAKKLCVDVVRVDDAGIGGAVTDNLLAREPRRYQVQPINVGMAPTKFGPDGARMFKNLRAQMNLDVSQQLTDGAISIDESFRETTLEQEGCDLRYFTREGTFQIEAKEKFIARNSGSSPDAWDSFVLAFADVRIVAAPTAQVGGDLMDEPGRRPRRSHNIIEERY